MEEMKRFSIGVNTEKYAWLAEQAKAHHRSMSGQVNEIIEQAMQEQAKEAEEKKAA
jgi:hypothetical protein